MMKDAEYITKREFFRVKGERAEERGDLEDAEYCAGVVRGLDLAFQDGTAKVQDLPDYGGGTFSAH